MTGLERLQSEYLGLFAYHLGIRPWEWDLLTVDEALELVRFVDQLEKQQE